MSDAVAPPDLETRHFQILLELAYQVSGSLDIGEVLSRSLAATRRLIDFRGGSIQLIEDDALRIAAADPEVSSEVADLRLPLGSGLSGRAATTGAIVYSSDLDEDPRVDPEVRRLGSNQGIRSYLAVPVVASGHIVGVLQIDSGERDAFSEEQRSMVASLAPLMGSAIQNAKIFAAELAIADRTREVDRLRSNFLSITTHELRTPLSALVGFAELLSRSDIHDLMDPLEIVPRLRTALDKMAYLLGQMKRAASTEGDTTTTETKPTEVVPAVELAVERFADRRKIVVEAEPNLPSASIDAELLIDALEALVANSINFSPEGSVVTIEVRKDENRITIAVIDEGPGVPAEDAQRIFEPFSQLQDPQTRAVGGLGIGLATARMLVEQMGGRLDVVPGSEGRFEVSFAIENPRD
jgi:K+-sensing histidine kinase KdpD